MKTVYPPEYHEQRKRIIDALEQHDQSIINAFNERFNGSLLPSRAEYEEVHKSLRNNPFREMCINALVDIERVTIPTYIITKEGAASFNSAGIN